MAGVLLLLLAAGAGLLWLWWGWHAEQPTVERLGALRQKFTVAPIGPAQLREVLGKRWGYLTQRVEEAELQLLKAADTQALQLGSLSQIQTLRLFDCQASPSTLSRLADLKKLQALTLRYATVEKPDLAFLEKLPALSTLVLTGDWAGPAGLEQVGRLKHLKFLGLDKAGMKDADLQALQGLSSLEQLWLWGNPISDAGPAHLQGLKSLKRLWIDQRLIDSPGMAKLKQAIPGLQVTGL